MCCRLDSNLALIITCFNVDQILSSTFNPDWSLTERNVIEEDAILVLDPETGDVTSGFGSNMFYLPHGLTIDSKGNTYATDTGLHQVIRVSGWFFQSSFFHVWFAYQV